MASRRSRLDLNTSAERADLDALRRPTRPILSCRFFRGADCSLRRRQIRYFLRYSVT
ncbi:hypothetical protein OH687_33020 [Burkholderia anthina]|nr:hypothetical protein OH687_33020 [Burkholderia anthina]